MSTYHAISEDCTWLRETALRGYDVPAFASFVLEGNEDCPLRITLYRSPAALIDDAPVAVFELVTLSHSNLSEYRRVDEQSKHRAKRARAIVDLANSRGSSFGDTSDDWINDPERMARCHDAAESGADGSTHREVIDDQRANVRNLCGSRERMQDCAMEYLDIVEAWHDRNGSLDQEVG